jgi:hypothetical protein
MGRSYARKPEVLMRLDSWSIERCWDKPSATTRRPEWYHDNEKSYVKHECPGRQVVKAVYVWPETDGTLHVACWRCSTPIPEGIKTVWIMHNWEELQHGG